MEPKRPDLYVSDPKNNGKYDVYEVGCMTPYRADVSFAQALGIMNSGGYVDGVWQGRPKSAPEPKRLDPTWEGVLPLLIDTLINYAAPDATPVVNARELLEQMAKAADLYNANVHVEVVNSALLKAAGEGVPSDPVDTSPSKVVGVPFDIAGDPVDETVLFSKPKRYDEHRVSLSICAVLRWIIFRQDTGQFIGPFITQADASRYAQGRFREGYTIQPLAKPIDGRD